MTEKRTATVAKRTGFTLLECTVAMAAAGVVATSFAVAIHRLDRVDKTLQSQAAALELAANALERATAAIRRGMEAEPAARGLLDEGVRRNLRQVEIRIATSTGDVDGLKRVTATVSWDAGGGLARRETSLVGWVYAKPGDRP